MWMKRSLVVGHAALRCAAEHEKATSRCSSKGGGARSRMLLTFASSCSSTSSPSPTPPPKSSPATAIKVPTSQPRTLQALLDVRDASKRLGYAAISYSA